jgi:hypothetical protein
VYNWMCFFSPLDVIDCFRLHRDVDFSFFRTQCHFTKKMLTTHNIKLILSSPMCVCVCPQEYMYAKGWKGWVRENFVECPNVLRYPMSVCLRIFRARENYCERGKTAWHEQMTITKAVRAFTFRGKRKEENLREKVSSVFFR